MDIKQARDNLLAVIDGIDKDKLDIAGLKTYAETLKVVSEIQVKSYQEYLSEMVSGFNTCAYKPATVSELKGGVGNGV
ncbi:MAG: hypothetical protein K2N06_05595 [Oscillospiraceae bacterium]|nr:hypothetical protein [Oscillospiraceae bacterium]